MRIWLKPDRMTQLGVTVTDVTDAINEQNAQFAPGKIGQPPVDSGQELVYSVTAKGRLADPRSSRTSSCARIRTARCCI